MILYPAFPLYLIWQFSRDRNLENAMVIYNVETGKPVLLDYAGVRKKPKNRPLIPSCLQHPWFTNSFQMKSKKNSSSI